jgi:uncharacterized membrane protein
MTRAPEQIAALETANRMADTLNANCPLRHLDRPGFDACMNRLKSQITGDGGTYTDGGNGARTCLLGFTASCTEGLQGAVHNWISQVRLKLQVAQ